MATGQEWYKYFEKKSQAYLINEMQVIDYTLNNLDKKIISEFQLSYLTGVKWAIQRVLREKYKMNSFGGVF